MTFSYSGHGVSCVVLRDNYQAIKGFDMLGVVGMFFEYCISGVFMMFIYNFRSPQARLCRPEASIWNGVGVRSEVPS